jgi:hypothetical protein
MADDFFANTASKFPLKRGEDIASGDHEVQQLPPIIKRQNKTIECNIHNLDFETLLDK